MDKDLNLSQIEENLRNWFKEKWVRFGPDGKIRGECARGDDSEGKPKCLPQAKAHALGKKGRASAAARKRREDPDAERRGPAKNVATKKKNNEEVEIEEAVKLGSKVKIHAPGKDYHEKVGHVGEIRHGAYKGAPKTYTVDYDHNPKTGYSKSVQLDKKHVKLHTEEVELDESLKTHYQNGYNAQKKGRTRQDNPHREGTPAAAMWAKGWEHSSDNKEPQKFVNEAVDSVTESWLPYEQIPNRWAVIPDSKKEFVKFFNTHDSAKNYAGIHGGRVATIDQNGREIKPTRSSIKQKDVREENEKSPMYKDAVQQDRIRSLKNLISIYQEKGRRDKVQELKVELKNLLIKTAAEKHKFGSAELNLLTIPELEDLLVSKVLEQRCPECRGPIFHEDLLEGKDACYYKVKSRYKVWPSAYASGALVKCRKKGAKNWGNKSESINRRQMTAEDGEVYPASSTTNASNSQSIQDLGKKYLDFMDKNPTLSAALDVIPATRPIKTALDVGANLAQGDIKGALVGGALGTAGGSTLKTGLKKLAAAQALTQANKQYQLSQQQKNTQDQTQNVAAVNSTDNSNLEEALGAFLGGLFRGAAPTVARQSAPTVARQSAPTVARQSAPTVARQATTTASKNAGKKLDKLGTVGGVTAALDGSGSAGAASSITTTYCVIDPDGNQVACFATSEEAQSYLNSLPNKQGYTIQAKLEESQIKNIDKKLYYKISYTSEDALINEFKMQKDSKGWFLLETSSNKSKLEALRAFGLPIVMQEGYEPAAGTGGTATLGPDNTVSPVGSIPKTQRINNKKQGTKNG